MSVSRHLEFHCGMSFTSVMKTGVRFQPAVKQSLFHVNTFGCSEMLKCSEFD